MLKFGLIGAIVLTLVSMGAAGWFYWQIQYGAGARAAGVVASPAGDAFSRASENERDERAQSAVEMAKKAVYISVQPPIVANYDDDGERGYYQATVELLTYDTDAEPAIQMHMPRLRDALLKLFSAQTTQTLRRRNAMDELRALAKVEVDKVMAGVLGVSPVAGVYFSTFVVQ